MMSLFYKVAYRIGLKPWEEMATLPIAIQIASLLDREQNERQAPYGSALDLGCGSGIWTLELARRSWQVTGIDIVPKAVRIARRRIQDAGISAQIVQGDVTTLRSAGVGFGFNFVLDFGTIHGLRDERRRTAAREVSAVTATRGTMIILAWIPAYRGPLPRGMSRQEIQEIFPDWTIIDEQIADVNGAPGFVRKSEPRFYRLRRK